MQKSHQFYYINAHTRLKLNLTNQLNSAVFFGIAAFHKTPKVYYAENLMPIPALNSSQVIAFNAFLGIAATTVIKIVKEKQRTMHRVLVLEKGRANLLNKGYILNLLEEYPILLREYMQMKNNDDIEVMKSFLDILDMIETDVL